MVGGRSRYRTGSEPGVRLGVTRAGYGAGMSQQPLSRQTLSNQQEEPMTASRQSLPPTRESVPLKVSVARPEGYLTIGLYPDGSPGEIFIKMSKEGSTISGMCQAFCRAFSL